MAIFKLVVRFCGTWMATHFLTNAAYRFTLYPNAAVLMRNDGKFNIFVYDIQYHKKVCIENWVADWDTRVLARIRDFPMLRIPRMIGPSIPLCSGKFPYRLPMP